MKKIGIITLNGNTNYGNRLQNYALKTVLSNLSFEVETIWFVKSKQVLLKSWVKSLCIFDKRYARYSKFKRFSSKYLAIKYYTDKEISSLYDYFVVGSDQVWNWSIYKDFETYLLKFSEKEKNISYAASFGVGYIKEEYHAIYRDGLQNMKAISVREETGKSLVHSVAERDSEVVLDPTMLLKKEDWSKILKKPKKLKDDRYILTYFLGSLSEKAEREIKRVATENHCQVINILDKESPFYTSGIEEFLYLEKNAFLVCTDSFHSSVFSILFDTPFLVFQREDQNLDMNTRMETLLSKFQLEDRIFHGEITKSQLEHNYENAYNILEKERKKSLQFLESALDIRERDSL